MGRGIAAARTSGWPAMAGTPDFEAHPARRRRAAPDPGKALPPTRGSDAALFRHGRARLRNRPERFAETLFQTGVSAWLCFGVRSPDSEQPRAPAARISCAATSPGSVQRTCDKESNRQITTRPSVPRQDRQPPVRSASPTSRKKAKVSGSRSPREAGDQPPRSKAAQL